MPSTTDRMGVTGADVAGYGAKVDLVLRGSLAVRDLTRDDKLALAWALVDQASSLRTTKLAQAAMTAIEDLYDAEEER
jgi:hypothetical protein